MNLFKAALLSIRYLTLIIMIQFRKVFALLVLPSAFSFSALAQNTFATLDFKQFYAPGTGNFMEVYTSVSPLTCALKRLGVNQLQANIEITEIIRQEDKIIDFRKKNLASPVFADSAIYDFLHQERFAVTPGNYVFEFVIRDLNDTTQPSAVITQPFEVPVYTNNISISDIELLERFQKSDFKTVTWKSGYDLIPYVSNYYPDEINKLAFYFEVYASIPKDDNEKYLLYQFIENSEGKKIESLGKFTKFVPAEVTPTLQVFDITDLETGSYNLKIEVRNKKNELVASESLPFQRVNLLVDLSDEAISQAQIENTFVAEWNNTDTINDYLACLRPISANKEADLIDKHLRTGSDLIKKQFIYSFWLSRNSAEPEKEWLKYKKQVDVVNLMFSTRIKRGYQTDRGRVYLKYGAPNQVTDRPSEPSSYPYQVWHYYRAGQYTNKRFIFYMPDLVTNDYEVLHSDIPGEYKNYRWETFLHSRNTPMGDVDSNGNGNFNHYGGNSKDVYRFPR